MKHDEPASVSLIEEMERARVRELEQAQYERDRAETALNECVHLAALTREVSIALIQNRPLQSCLLQCTQVLVLHLGAAFARIWTLNKEEQMLELQASAGIYTHLNGAHSRIPVGMFKIGLIAAERRPHLTNAVIGDPRVSDQEWAKREGMVAFAGYPLLVEGELVGVMGLFARQPLSKDVLDAMGAVSNIIALGIECKHIEEERTRTLAAVKLAAEQAEAARFRLARILDNLTDGFMIFDEEWRYSYINPQAEPYTGKPWQGLLGKNVWEEFPELVGSMYYEQYHRAILHQEPVIFEVFASTLSNWFDVRAYPIPGGLAVYFRNITDRKRAEEERRQLLESAERARSEAEAALQVRNNFLSSISHDLKTPLAVMRGNIQLVQRRIRRGEVPDTEWLAERLSGVEASTMKMNRMLEDLLDMAKLQAGQELDLDIRPVQLIPLVEQVRTELQETAKYHQIIVDALVKEVVVEGDHMRLDRVFTNLLSNAIKYSPAGGTIMIEITREEEQGQCWASVSVRDQGVGIPASDQPYLFRPFYRASNIVAKIQGTGVGLASVAQIINQHGGTISMSSEEGQGSTFTVRLLCAESE